MSAVGGQRPRQRDKSRDRNVFGARGRVKAGRREQRRHIGAERAQALAEHFASLAERGLGDVLKKLAVAGLPAPAAAPDAPPKT